MDVEKLQRYNRRIRKFVFAGDEDVKFSEYYKANRLEEQQGEEIRLKAVQARHAVVRGMGTKKLVIGILVAAVSIAVFFMTKGMVPEMKKNVDYAVYGGIAIGSIFLSSGAIYLLAPGHRKGELMDPELES